jgi:hypothetical protein
VGWLFFVALQTLGYLSTIFGRALLSIIDMILGEAEARRLFQSNLGEVAPLWEQLIGVAAMLLLALAQPLGLWQVWRRHRANIFVLILSLASVAYFGMQALRLTRAGWETGNRASDFLFVGLGFVTALALAGLWGEQRLGWARWLADSTKRAALTGCVAVVIVGGVIAGWSRDLRVGWPYRLAVGDHVIEPQGQATAEWAQTYLGPDHRMAADASNSLLLLDYGEQYAFSGRNGGFQEVIAATPLADWQLDLLRDARIEYVVVDRRHISWDNMAGLYFGAPAGAPVARATSIDLEVFAKFERQDNVSRVYDSGNIAMYDVSVLSGLPKIR